MNESLHRFLEENWARVVGGLVGFLVALIIVIFGFWRGLFIIICVLAGIYLGGRMEKKGILNKFVSSIWHDRDRF